MAHIDITVVPPQQTPQLFARRHLGSGFVECVNRGNKGEYGGSEVRKGRLSPLPCSTLHSKSASVAFNAKDLVIRKQSAAASQPALDVQR
ncbi:hypothetical protein TNCV_1886601 [Trichonephila clavipes]|nr:hypothetical protein TNCV_1886601 [Trichonephila clavipes]